MTLDHPALPPAVSRPWVGAATGTWLGMAFAGRGWGGLVGVAALVGYLAIRRNPLIATAITLAVLSSLLAAAPLAPYHPAPFRRPF